MPPIICQRPTGQHVLVQCDALPATRVIVERATWSSSRRRPNKWWRRQNLNGTAIALRGALRRLFDHCRSAFRTTHLALPPSTPESLAAIGANPAHAQRCIGQQWGLDRHEQRRHRRQLADRCKCNDGHCSLTISISRTGVTDPCGLPVQPVRRVFRVAAGIRVSEVEPEWPGIRATAPVPRDCSLNSVVPRSSAGWVLSFALSWTPVTFVSDTRVFASGLRTHLRLRTIYCSKIGDDPAGANQHIPRADADLQSHVHLSHNSPTRPGARTCCQV